VANLFGAYELLAKSGLFDAEYYLRANPDIAALNIDPLTHYLERGGVELRNPSGAFDARHYAQLCIERGERFDNPLLHYLEFGAAQGLSPRPQDNSVAQPEPPPLLLGLDRMSIDSGPAGTRLAGAGWCLAATPIVELEIALGASRTRARYGVSRADVAL
jgi:hypothetical protein